MNTHDQPGKTADLSDSLHRRLSMYAVAASAAGVSLLALAPSAQAKIVYTQTHQLLGVGDRYRLDLNHDGIVDFVLSNTYYPPNFFVDVRISGRNKVAGGHTYAYPLPPGAKIGPALAFDGLLLAWSDPNGVSDWSGPWLNVGARYLGMHFQIKGKLHYGWARVNVLFFPYQGFAARLTGYAYETVPNKAIIAGKTKGKDVVTFQPASLGHLAAGQR